MVGYAVARHPCSCPVLLLGQASAADAAPHWEAFFAPLREQHPISAAAVECFKAASTVHKFEKASKLVKPGGAAAWLKGHRSCGGATTCYPSRQGGATRVWAALAALRVSKEHHSRSDLSGAVLYVIAVSLCVLACESRSLCACCARLSLAPQAGR